MINLVEKFDKEFDYYSGKFESPLWVDVVNFLNNINSKFDDSSKPILFQSINTFCAFVEFSLVDLRSNSLMNRLDFGLAVTVFCEKNDLEIIVSTISCPDDLISEKTYETSEGLLNALYNIIKEYLPGYQISY